MILRRKTGRDSIPMYEATWNMAYNKKAVRDSMPMYEATWNMAYNVHIIIDLNAFDECIINLDEL